MNKQDLEIIKDHLSCIVTFAGGVVEVDKEFMSAVSNLVKLHDSQFNDDSLEQELDLAQRSIKLQEEFINQLQQQNKDLQLAVTEYEKWIKDIGDPAVQQNKAYEEAFEKYSKELDKRYKESIEKWNAEADMYSQGMADGYDMAEQLLKSFVSHIK